MRPPNEVRPLLMIGGGPPSLAAIEMSTRSIVIIASVAATSTICPAPVVSRAISAAQVASASAKPASASWTRAPAMIGEPEAAPRLRRTPAAAPEACARVSALDGHSAAGPSSPHGVTAAMIRRG